MHICICQMAWMQVRALRSTIFWYPDKATSNRRIRTRLHLRRKSPDIRIRTTSCVPCALPSESCKRCVIRVTNGFRAEGEGLVEYVLNKVLCKVEGYASGGPSSLLEQMSERGKSTTLPSGLVLVAPLLHPGLAMRTARELFQVRGTKQHTPGCESQLESPTVVGICLENGYPSPGTRKQTLLVKPS